MPTFLIAKTQTCSITCQATAEYLCGIFIILIFFWNVFVTLFVVFVAFLLSFICFFCFSFCWAHNEKHSFGMIIDANKSIYIYIYYRASCKVLHPFLKKLYSVNILIFLWSFNGLILSFVYIVHWAVINSNGQTSSYFMCVWKIMN